MGNTPFMYEVSEGTRDLVHTVWNDHYKKGNEASPIESLARVVDAIYKKDATEKDSAMDMVLNGYFCPGGRIHAGAGTTNRVTLINCFVSGTIEDSLDSIMDRLKEAALTQQRGGGIGMDFSTLRPEDAVVVRTNSISSGVLPFMDMWHYMCETIKSAGVRRGAMMGVLRIDHPDVIKFIEAKQVKKRLENFNVSVGVTDDFMEAVKNNMPWHLHFPVPHKDGNQKFIISENYKGSNKGTSYIYKTLPARELWDMLIKSTFEYAEPGVLFIDRINDLNNLSYCEKISATNPCVTGDTYVFDDMFARRASTILPGDRITTAGLRTHPVKDVEVNEDAQVFKVNFSDGGELICTANHIFQTRAHQHAPFEEKRLREINENDLITVSNGPRYFKDTDSKLNCKNLNLYGLNEFEYGFQYGAARVKYGWVEKRKTSLHKQTVNAILDAVDEDKWQSKEWFDERHLLQSSQKCRWGMLSGVLSTIGRIENKGKDDFQIVIPGLNPTLLQQLRLLFLHCTIHPDYREQDRSLIIKDENLRTLTSIGPLFQVDQVREVEEHIASHPLKPTKWYARIRKIEALVERQDVFDLHEPTTDTWITNGYVSKGCGEQPLPPYGQCDLGAINLARMVRRPFGEYPLIDWNALEGAVSVGVRFLDNVLDETGYPLEQQQEEALSKRRIGLGITGLGNFLEFVKQRYGSEESLKTVNNVMQVIFDSAYQASALLAKEKGAFPLFNLEEFKKTPSWSKLTQPTKYLIETYGLRNGVLLTVAPTGSTSIYYGNVSSGIEPVFQHRYQRRVLQPDGTPKWFYVHDYGFDKWVELFGEPESLRDLPDYMVTADQITVDEHLEMQQVVQYWIDSSISKTINCPVDIDYKDFKNVYTKAYDLGLKGCTTYRPSEMRGSVLKRVEETKQHECCETPRVVDQEGCEVCLNCGVSKCSI